MRVFVTAASGFIGAAVIAEQRAAHQVVGLARSQESASRVAALGATPRVASLDDLDRLAEAAAESGGRHSPCVWPRVSRRASSSRRPPCDRGPRRGAAGSGRPFVVTGGTLVLPGGRTGSERDRPDAEAPAAARGASEPIALACRSAVFAPR